MFLDCGLRRGGDGVYCGLVRVGSEVGAFWEGWMLGSAV